MFRPQCAVQGLCRKDVRDDHATDGGRHRHSFGARARGARQKAGRRGGGVPRVSGGDGRQILRRVGTTGTADAASGQPLYTKRLFLHSQLQRHDGAGGAAGRHAGPRVFGRDGVRLRADARETRGGGLRGRRRDQPAQKRGAAYARAGIRRCALRRDRRGVYRRLAAAQAHIRRIRNSLFRRQRRKPGDAPAAAVCIGRDRVRDARLPPRRYDRVIQEFLRGHRQAASRQF